MPYAFHIVRGEADEDGLTDPVPLDEWKSAVNTVPGVRLAEGQLKQATASGAVIAIPLADGDLEIELDGEWRPFVMYRSGRPTLARIDPRDESSAPVQAVFALIDALGARLEGDEGEVYGPPV